MSKKKGRTKKHTIRRKARGTAKGSATNKRLTKSASKAKRKAPKVLREKVRPIASRRTKQRLDEIEKAKLVVDDRLRQRIPVAETRWLTPTKRGFDAVDRRTTALWEHYRRKNKSEGIELYTFSLYVTFTGPDGKPVVARNEGVGIPIPAHIQDKTGIGRKGKFVGTVRENIRRKIYNLMSDRFDIVSPGKHVAAGQMTKAEAVKLMRKIRQGRDARFKLIIYRQGV